MVAIEARREAWGLWVVSVALLAVELAVPYLVPSRRDPWQGAETAVAGFVLALLSFPAAVSTFALREQLADAAAARVARVRFLLLALWGRCLLIGLFGCVMAYGAASPAAAWPFAAGAAVLLVLHAPRHSLLAPPAL